MPHQKAIHPAKPNFPLPMFLPISHGIPAGTGGTVLSCTPARTLRSTPTQLYSTPSCPRQILIPGAYLLYSRLMNQNKRLAATNLCSLLVQLHP